MAGMGGPTSRFCHETVKQQISGEGAGSREQGQEKAQKTNTERRTPNIQRRMPNAEPPRIQDQVSKIGIVSRLLSPSSLLHAPWYRRPARAGREAIR
jgi:hypothetical protein